MRTPSGLDQLCSNAHALAGLAHGAFQDVAYAQLPADLLHVYSPPFASEARIAGDNEEPADARKRSDDPSTMPSLKYSCSGSPLMFWNGSTAIDGFSGNAGSGSVNFSFRGSQGTDFSPSKTR